MAAAVVLALAGSVLSASTGVRQAAPGEPPARKAPEEAPVAAAADAASAARLARAQGSRVEALDLRTETRAVYAEPGGSMTAELNPIPVRVRQGTGWVDVDLTLIRRADGSVGPQAAAVDLSFSGGGTRSPLITYGRAGKRFSLSWPGSLPSPVLAGPEATYVDVWPGVDLVVRAKVDGYTQYLVIKDKTAARNPAVAAVRLGLRADGLRVNANADGGLTARDAKSGAVAFAAPPSRMWDSSATRREAVAKVAVNGGSLTLRPDAALLADPATTFPVTVDPDWSPVGLGAWTSTLSGKATTRYWNSSGDPPWAQVGQCWNVRGQCNGIGEAWSYFQFNTGFLGGTQILSATLDTVMVHGPDCNAGARNHQMFLAGGQITPDTSWSNRPQGGLLDTRSVPACGTHAVGFDTHGSIHINDAGGISTYFLKAADSGDQNAWRKYDPGQTRMRVNFNRRPNPPYNLTTQPPLTACRWCGGVPYVGDDFITLQANLSDNDPGEIVHPVWHIYRDGVREDRNTCPCQASGSVFTTSVDLRAQDRKRIQWGLEASDNYLTGDGRSGQEFFVDRGLVTKEPGVAGVLYREDNRWHGGVGVPDTFTFTANGFKDVHGVNDIDHYLYGWADPPSTKVDAAGGLGGNATVTLTPPGDGPRDLFVQMVDRAGHRSPTRAYHIYVRPGSGALAKWSFEGNADDEAYLGDRNGTVSGGVRYAAGAVGSGLQLDGLPGSHVSAPNAVRTDASFSVSAWVRLDGNGTYARAAVSQDGTKFAGFDLWYRPENGGHWVFGMANSDAAYQGTDMATSAAPAQRGTWTHLTGVYDGPARQLRLYVNGALAGTGSRTVAAWHAAGPVRIGQTMWDGNAAVDFWPGGIDEVQLYDRALSAAEVRAAVGADNVQAGHWKFDDATGTTARNAVEGGEMVALVDGASFTGATGGAVGGAAQFNTTSGSDDYAATTGSVVRTDESFAVAAWLKPTVAPTSGNARIALSQEGAVNSGFFLAYRETAADDVWEVLLPSQDSGPGRPADTVIRSNVAAQLNTWTHVALVYDAATRQVRLYVNGQPAGTATRTGGFHATGPFTIGRGKWESIQGGGPWVGAIDEVRAYTRELSDDEIRGIVAGSNVTAGSWKLNGNANDSSGNSRNGTLQGGPDWTGGQTNVPDPTDLAVRLNGTGAHVSAPNTVDVRRSFSISAWAKLDRAANGAAVVSQDAGRVSAVNLHVAHDGKWVNAMRSCDANWVCGETRAVGATAQVGVWTHLVAVYDAAAGRLSIYVNGVLAGSQAYRHTWNQAGGALHIGRATWGNSEQVDFFPGAIDDVAVYGRILFADEIRALAGRDLSLVHNWPLDEASGTHAADAVGAQAGTLQGGAGHAPGRLGNAVQLDGTDDVVTSPGTDLRTDASFTVSAWVYLDRRSEPISQFSAVSLDGVTTSKFRLGHVADDQQNFCLDEVYEDPNKCGAWIFEMPNADDASPPLKAAVSTLPAEITRWVHLVGVYDAQTTKIWLYVDGSRVGDGTINNPWAASGGVQIGRAKVAGGPAQYWPGRVDDVRLYTGALDRGRIENLYRAYPREEGPAALPTDAVGHWKFADPVGSATAADSSGQNRPMTLAGGAALAGWFLRLNGTSAYAETPGPVLDTSRSFSVAAWAYMDRTGGGNRVVLGQDGNRVSAFRVEYRVDSGKWAVVVPTTDADNPTSVVLASAGPAAFGDWVHVAVVYDATLQQLRLYVNGVLSGAQVGVTVRASTGKFALGRARWNGSNVDFFIDGIDDVRAFGRALSDGEVRRIHDDILPALHGRYPFDDGTARDDSSRHNDVTLSGGTSFTAGVNGQALRLNGTTGSGTAIWLGAPTRDSFTVSAWAKLSSKDHDGTVLAQDGTRMSGFALQYRRGIDRWVFAATAQDADGATVAYAHAVQPAVLNQWVHLTGVYDQPARQLRLYVNGTLVGTKSNVLAWHVHGPLTIGRAKVNGAPADFFAGDIDEVVTDKWIVPDTEIAERAGYTASPAGQLGRFVNEATGDRYTAAIGASVPAGYRFERSLGVPVAAGANTRTLYACQAGTDRFTSTDPGCETATRIGEVGVVYTAAPAGTVTVAIYRCTAGTERFESLSSTCDGLGTSGAVLGFASGYARLARYYSRTATDHISTTYAPPPGYRFEGAQGWLVTLAQAGTRPLLGCRDGDDHFVSVDPACEGATVLGTYGHLFTTPPDGVTTVTLYQCVYSGQRFVSGRADCEGQGAGTLLGHALTAPPTP